MILDVGRKKISNSQYGRFSYGAACSESPPYLVDSPFGDDFGVGRDLRARRFLCSRPYCELLMREGLTLDYVYRFSAHAPI